VSAVERLREKERVAKGSSPAAITAAASAAMRAKG